MTSEVGGGSPPPVRRVNEDGLASRRLAESFGGRGRSLDTVYEKPLGSRSPNPR